jgi:hypothetical protein
VVTWNVRGSIVRCLPDPTLQGLIGSADVLVFTETWEEPEGSHPAIKGYVVHTACRPAAKDRGGVSVYVKQGLHSERLHHQVDPEVAWVSIPPLLLGACYVRPQNSRRGGAGRRRAEGTMGVGGDNPFNEVASALNDIAEHTYTLLVGDFNARCGLLDDTQVKVDVTTSTPESGPVVSLFPKRLYEDVSVNPWGKYLVAFCQTHDMVILNGRVPGDSVARATYHCTSVTPAAGQDAPTGVIDLAVCSHNLFQCVRSLRVADPTPLTDHSIVVTELELPRGDVFKK